MAVKDRRLELMQFNRKEYNAQHNRHRAIRIESANYRSDSLQAGEQQGR